MKTIQIKLGLIGIGLVLALPAQAAQDVPWTSATTKRDTQIRAVYGGWDYQPGYPKGTYPKEKMPSIPVAGAGQASDAPVNQPTWRHPTPKVEVVPEPELEPRTKTSAEATFQFSRYKYYEKVDGSNFMSNAGLKYGFGGAATGVIAGDWFARLEGRYAFGDVDYNGSGTLNDATDETFELRVLGGYDIAMGRVVVSPYAGFGYRNLFNDLRGTSTTGARGYRRDSQYVYIPLGVEPRYQIDRNSRVSLKLEVDPILGGWQESHLSDTGIPGLSDVTNKQNIGYGFKGELMYQYWRLSLGPYVNFWHIRDSDPAECDGVWCFVEPNNKTLEYGVQFRGHLY